jgi:colanic acid/amylovoran biosynthesis protein
MTYTFGLIGATIWGNRGAEAMLVTSIGQMRQRFPDSRFVIFSYYPSKDRSLIKDKSVRVISATPRSLILRHFPLSLLAGVLRLVGIRLPDGLLNKTVRALRECDVLLDVSGISFADEREKFIPFNVLNMWPALLVGTPVIKLAQAMGPFTHPFVRIPAQIFLPKCAQIHARGDTTAENLDDLGLSYKRSADIAFLFEDRFSLSDENADEVSSLEAELQAAKAAGRNLMVLVPSSVVYEKTQRGGIDYVDHLLRIIEHFEGDVVVMPNATRQGEDTAHNNDLFVIALLKQRAQAVLSPERLACLHWVTFGINTAGTRKLMRHADLVVTSRFHSMISALSLGIPPIVIGWSHKYAEVLTDFGIEKLTLDFTEAGESSALMSQAMQTRSELSTQIQDRLQSVQAIAKAQFDDVEALLRGNRL